MALASNYSCYLATITRPMCGCVPIPHILNPALTRARANHPTIVSTMSSLHYAPGPCVKAPQPKNRVWTKAPLLGWPKATSRAVACHASQDHQLGRQQQQPEPERYSRAWFQRDRRKWWRQSTFWGLLIPVFYMLLRWLVYALRSWLAGGA